MKHCWIIALFIVLIPFYTNAQNCYNMFYKNGEEALKSEDFETAVKNFEAAKVCDDKPPENDINERIVKAQNGYIIAIEIARYEAIKAKEEAKRLATIADQEKHNVIFEKSKANSALALANKIIDALYFYLPITHKYTRFLK